MNDTREKIEDILNRLEKSWASEDEWAVEELLKLLAQYADSRLEEFWKYLLRDIPSRFTHDARGEYAKDLEVDGVMYEDINKFKESVK